MKLTWPTMMNSSTVLDPGVTLAEMDKAYLSWKAAHRSKMSAIATMLRSAADRLEQTGLPMIENNIPGWGDVLLVTEENQIEGEGPFDESVVDGTDGRVKVIVGPHGVANCVAVVVLPVHGKSVRITTEEKP